ncbi:nucleotidyl transferase AbiEii/AbiGii toxin family protein [Carnobacterium sp. TMP28]
MKRIVAEKLDEILYLIKVSSRIKDYYDIYYLATTENLMLLF